MTWMLCHAALMLCSGWKRSSPKVGGVLVTEGSQLSLQWKLLSLSLESSLAKEHFSAQGYSFPQE